jgi:hypothetical protein
MVGWAAAVGLDQVADQDPDGQGRRCALVAAGQPVTGTRLAEAAGVDASYRRALEGYRAA